MAEIAIRRLWAQGLAEPKFQAAGEVVNWLGAVQAQEYPGGSWTIGMRLPGSTTADIEAAVADKSVVRVFFMRGTIHFVPGADIRWMLPLVAERVRRLLHTTAKYNKTGLEEADFLKAKDVLAKAMQGNAPLIRDEIKQAMIEGGIKTSSNGYMFLLQRAQIDGLVCYGAHRGKQQTFTLLDEWVPPASILDREAGLAEFARRYFVSHGPATLHDYANWAGLPMADARAGLDANRAALREDVIDGTAYYSALDAVDAPLPQSPSAHLLQMYDEFFLGYKDRTASIDPAYQERWSAQDPLFGAGIIIDGRMAGTWRRVLKAKTITYTFDFFEPLSDAQHQAVLDAAWRYADFLGLEAVFDMEQA
jgi:hypothetical protein